MSVGTILWQGMLSRLLPWTHETLLYARWYFGVGDILPLALAASAGAAMAYALLYLAGRKLYGLLPYISTDAQQARTLRIRPYARYGVPLLLVLAPSVSYFGVLAALAAGFYALDKRTTAIALLLGELILRRGMLGL